MIEPTVHHNDLVRKALIGIRDARSITDPAERKAHWDGCWGAHAAPPYYGSAYIRCHDGALTKSGIGEHEFLVQLRAELFTTYLREVKQVSEFGCGTGHNLVPLQSEDKWLRGFDWSETACQRARAQRIEAEVFDMFSPSAVHGLGGAVLTVHALEQLGKFWQPFVQFLLLHRPLLCIHIEPIEELYNELDLWDFLALAYHRKRGYLTGFLTGVKAMAEHGQAEILEARRTFVGNLHHEAYSVVVWRAL